MTLAGSLCRRKLLTNPPRKVALISFYAFACNSISKLYLVALIADITALVFIISSLIRYTKAKKQASVNKDE